MLLATGILCRYIAAGSTTGALYKFKYGPRAIATGWIFGGILGTAVGCLNWAVMHLTGLRTSVFCILTVTL